MKLITCMRWLSVAWILMFFIAVTPSHAIESSVEDAILQGNWDEVYKILERDDIKANDPVARLIMAHVCLATNRNNESMLLFLSAKEESDLERWSQWTDSLLHRHPQSPECMYLSADAEARQGRLEEAARGFTRALDIKEGYPLALNARGVVRVLNEDWDSALMDFLEATRQAPDFADAHANLGTYWLLKEAPEGALEAFNQALAINSEFALAYNGRGCAYFGRGKYEYDAAIDDMEKAFELCPALLPALSNQGLVLSALTSSSTPQRSDTANPGTSIIAKSDLEKLDYASLTTADQMIKFHQSVNELGEKDPISALRVYSVQLAKMGDHISDLSHNIEQRRSAIAAAGQAEKSLWMLDQTLSLMDMGKNVANVVPQDGWKTWLNVPQHTLQTFADLSPKDTKAEYYSGLGYRTLSQNPIVGLLRGGSYIMEKTARTYGYIAENELGGYSSELVLRTRQYYDLKQEQQKYIALAVNRKIDFSRGDVLGLGTMYIPPSSQRSIPTYSIPNQSPLTQFDVLPGAIGKDIAPPGKTPLVVIDGNTDIQRLGTMVRGFEGRGVHTLLVPADMDAQSFGRMVGADRIVQINQKPGDVAWLPKVPSPGPNPGGVKTDMSGAQVDLGDWPVLTSFGLFYRAGPSGNGGNRKGEK